MTLKSKSRWLVFNDGLADCYEVTDRKIVGEKQIGIHFNRATVGERRFWDAMVQGVEITRAIKVPEGTNVERGDLLIIDGKQFLVVQKDYRDEKLPVSWLLSLTSSPIVYKQAA